MNIIMDEQLASCPDCKKAGREWTVIVDHHAGDLVCTSCGLVLQGQCIDMGQEWRDFADEGVDRGMKVNSRCRGGDDAGRLDSVLEQSLDSTTVDGTGSAAKALQRAQQMADSQVKVKLSRADRALQAVFSEVERTAKGLNLDDVVVEKAFHLVKLLAERGKVEKKKEASWIDAVIYLACREERATRTMLEIVRTSLHFHTGKPRTEDEHEKLVKQKVQDLKKVLRGELTVANVDSLPPEELMRRFVSRLQLSSEVCLPAVAIVQGVSKCGLARCSGDRDECALIAATIFAVAHLFDVPNKPRLTDAALIAIVPERMVKEKYSKVLRPHVGAFLQGFESRVKPGALEGLPVLDDLPCHAARV